MDKRLPKGKGAPLFKPYGLQCMPFPCCIFGVQGLELRCSKSDHLGLDWLKQCWTGVFSEMARLYSKCQIRVQFASARCTGRKRRNALALHCVGSPPTLGGEQHVPLCRTPNPLRAS
ncbi:hypothetical protein TNCV_4491731 [Trichonephila clavipes]|nr:hypothetical protein TNCV_4491731 [Trichonephila clavipes]